MQVTTAIIAAAVTVIGAAAPSVSAQVSRYDPVTMDPIVRDTVNPPSREELALTSHGFRLNGFMYIAQGAGPHPTVILLHGYPGVEKNLDLAQAIRRAGMNVLYFDYRGSWGSAGVFSFASAQEDVAAAIDYVRSPENARRLRGDPTRVALIGHSMGGWLAFLGAAADPAIKCVGGIEAADMTLVRGQLSASPHFDSAFIVYANFLTAPGGPLRGSSESLLASVKVNAKEWALPNRAANLVDRTMLLLDNKVNQGHAPFVAALKAAGARKLSADVWDTDHTFSDRRIELAHRVVSWLRSECHFP